MKITHKLDGLHSDQYAMEDDYATLLEEVVMWANKAIAFEETDK